MLSDALIPSEIPCVVWKKSAPNGEEHLPCLMASRVVNPTDLPQWQNGDHHPRVAIGRHLLAPRVRGPPGWAKVKTGWNVEEKMTLPQPFPEMFRLFVAVFSGINFGEALILISPILWSQIGANPLLNDGFWGLFDIRGMGWEVVSFSQGSWEPTRW